MVNASGEFPFSDCPKKHHVRMNGWLPACAVRKQIVDELANPEGRRLRYFTFCAVGAIDVLMFDVAMIVTASKDTGFNTVAFFDRTNEGVGKTQQNIPGSNGFPGDFVMLMSSLSLEDLTILELENSLSPSATELDEPATRDKERRRNSLLRFYRCFPFDIVNFDLEEFLFKPTDYVPGKVIQAMNNFLNWQHRPLDGHTSSKCISGFTLMLTTQIGPPNLNESYKEMLQDALQQNISRDGSLMGIIQTRYGVSSVSELMGQRFDDFFTVAVPKVLVGVLLDTDWFIDSDAGLQIFRFDRQSSSGPYTMLHFVMQVRAQDPPRGKRLPGSKPIDVQQAYATIVKDIFGNEPEIVTENNVNKDEITDSLRIIESRRKKYVREPE